MQAYSDTDHRVKVSGKVLIIWKPLKTRTWTLPVMWKTCFVIIKKKMVFRNIKCSCFHKGPVMLICWKYAYLQMFNVNQYKILNPRDLPADPYKITYFWLSGLMHQKNQKCQKAHLLARIGFIHLMCRHNFSKN